MKLLSRYFSFLRHSLFDISVQLREKSVVEKN